MKTTTRKETGFTIIEVVLVLAIAGLIFLVVFLALPQLQRSQRDSQRRSDAGRYLSALESYASNNNGSYPGNQTATDTFVADYLRNDGAIFDDPSGVNYVVNFQNGGANPTIAEPDGNIYYARRAQCGNSEGQFTAVAGADRKVAVIVPLENGTSYCQDNR